MKNCAVVISNAVDWHRDYSRVAEGQLIGLSNSELSEIDPLAANLIIAKSTHQLRDMEIARFQSVVNRWAEAFRDHYLPDCEEYFHEQPGDFKNDIRFFRVGMLSQFLENEVGIQYQPSQRQAREVYYTDASDLFLNGVIDRYVGTCGNMAALYVAIAWRLRWPLSLACVGSHFITRFDDGETTFNIEATQSGFGGFKSDPDDYLIRERGIPGIAIECGSDLRAISWRELLGVFVGLRARHSFDSAIQSNDMKLATDSENDWLLARHLFPSNRTMYKSHLVAATMRGSMLFNKNENGHPSTYAYCVREANENEKAFEFERSISSVFQSINI